MTNANSDTPSALTGIRVVEFGPYVALPLTGRILGSLGAEVIKVETNKVLDEMAFIPAWSRGAGQPEYQRGKRRITLDVRTDAGRDLILEMVRISDVFMTNFRRNVLDRWGIDFPEIRRQRPDSIIMWQTGLGGHGPYYTYKSFGILVQHLSGVSLMTGLPDEPPGVVNTSYSDYHTGVFQPAGIIAALMRRNLTGKTATLESSIFKSGVATCGPPSWTTRSTDAAPNAGATAMPGPLPKASILAAAKIDTSLSQSPTKSSGQTSAGQWAIRDGRRPRNTKLASPAAVTKTTWTPPSRIGRAPRNLTT